MTFRSAPIISIPNCSNTPWSWSSHAQFNAVCPPRVGRTASIGVPSSRSFSMIFRTDSGVMGSMYVRSLIAGSVMIVAGFELTRTTRYPSSFSALHAWVPE